MKAIGIVRVRHLAAVFAVAAVAWCSSGWAQVLDLVPSDSMVVLKINNLQGVSTKIAKLAKDFGLDQLQPQFQDPLGAMMEQGKMTKGVNKSGEMALAILDFDTDPPKFLMMMPVDDYKAFISNFEAVGSEAAGVSEVKVPDGPNLFITHRGQFAVGTHDKTVLDHKAAGLKLASASAKDAQGKDAILFLNIPAVREKALKTIRDNRQTAVDEMVKNMSDDANAKQFVGVAKVVVGEAFDLAERFLSDCEGVVFSANINDQGISLGAVSQFAADSKFGKTVAQFKNTNKPLLTGLPDRKYFFFGGMAADPKVLSKVVGDIVDPINKELIQSGDNGKQIARLLETAKTLCGSINRVSAGYPVAQGAMGAESVIQQVSVIDGDAKAIHDAEMSMLKGVGDLLALIPKEAGQVKLDIQPGIKTVDGVKLDSYTMNVAGDPNDPKAAQMQQMMGMIYGPNGMSGVMGIVDDRTLVFVQGGTDKLLADAIASARSHADALSSSKNVQMIAAQLPKERSLEEYIALDNIVTAGVKYAQNFGLPIKMNLPNDLPPLGVAAGTEGSAIRGEIFIPSTTVQNLISAGLQAYQQMQGGGNGKL